MKLFALGKNRSLCRARNGRDAACPPGHKPCHKPDHKNSRRAGNVFFALFAAVAMVGAVGYGMNTVLRGPIKSMTDVTRRTLAESTVVSSSRLAIVGATTQQTTPDCDNDGYIEPLPYRAAVAPQPAPTGGGHLPTGLLPDSIDPWKTEYGYCAWDSGPVTAAAGCGGATGRLAGGPANKQMAIAIISAGKDKKFQTVCNAYNGATPNASLVTRPAGSDDIVLAYSYAEANDLGAGMWKPDPSVANTAVTRNALEGAAGRGATFTDAVKLQGNVVTGGGLLLPGDPGDDSISGACNTANDKQIRRNLSGNPPTLEVCDFSRGLGWTTLSGQQSGGGGGGGGGGMSGQLVAHWKLDETSGTTAVDSVGGYNGTLHNGPTWSSTDAVDGGALGFDGNDDYVRVPDAAALKPDAITITAWVKRQGVGSDTWSHLVTKGWNFNSSLPWISYSLAIQNTPTPKLAFNVGRTGSNVKVFSPAPMPDNTWVFVAGTYDPSLADKQQKIYINGMLSATGINTSPILYDASDLSFGEGDNASPGEFHKGMIDDIRIYNYALSDEDIYNLYNNTKKGVVRNKANGQKGRIVTWGSNEHNKLGIGISESDLISVADPVSVVSGSDFVQVARACHAACGLKAGGTVWCWGWDSNGQLGNGTTTTAAQSIPVQVTGLTDVAQIDAGCTHACAVKRNGEAWCWGKGDEGKLGNGAAVDSDVPVKVSNITDFVKIAAGRRVTCGIRYNGEGWCWGKGDTGALGSGGTTSSSVPVKVGNNGETWSSIYVTKTTNDSACGVATTGEAYCWGEETNSNFGNGATSGQQNLPSKVLNSAGSSFWTDWVQVAVNWSHTCGIRSNGTAWCWGSDTNGAIGNGSTTTTTRNLPTQVSTYTDFKKITVGDDTACAIRANGNVVCWGIDTNGELANGSTVTATQTAPYPTEISNALDIGLMTTGGVALIDTNQRPVSLQSQSNAGRIAVGQSHACAIANDNTLSCWGDDTSGRLGNGAPTAVQYQPKVSDVGPWSQVSLSANGAFSCGLKTDGTAWCWGSDSNGQLGNGAGVTADQTSPYALSDAGPWTQISAGISHACGIKVDGTAWCWGQGGNGRLGNNGTSNQVSPVQVSGSYKWKYINAGVGSNSCGIQVDGSLWCWGSDSDGQLGNGTTLTADQITPSKVVEPGPWKMVKTGGTTCAIKEDGSLWCWGDDANARVGNGSSITTDYAVPTKVSTDKLFTSVSMGMESACGVDLSGQGWCWGAGDNGRAALGYDTAYLHVPTAMVGGVHFNEISVGHRSACGFDVDGSLYCWGNDATYLVGDGEAKTGITRNPTRLMNFPMRDAWSVSSDGGGVNLAPGADATLGTTRSMSLDGSTGNGLNFAGSGRSSIASTTNGAHLLIDATGDPNSSQLSLRTATSPGGQCAYQPSPVTFDGTDYISGTVGAGASTDTDKFTMSVWFRVSPTATEDTNILYEGQGMDGRVQIKLEGAYDGASDNKRWQLLLQFENSAGTNLAIGDGGGIRSNETIVAGNWYNALISVDTTNSYANLYVNDVSNIYNNNKTMNTGTIDFDNGHGFGTTSTPARVDGDLADVWIDVGSYIDFSIEANRRKFINKNLTPVYLGDNGSIPNGGSAPDIFMSGERSTWHINKGTAGGFNMSVGALDSGTSPLPTGTQSCTTPIIRNVGLDYASGTLKFTRDMAGAGSWVNTLPADLEIANNGEVGIGTNGSPQAALDVRGAIKIGSDPTCNAGKSGTIQWTGTAWQYCNGTSWKQFGPAGNAAWNTRSTPSTGSASCGVRSDGSLWCWGAQWALGDGHTNGDPGVPVRVKTDAGATGWNDWVMASSGGVTACGIRSNGTLWCWGFSDYGQLGNNTTGPDQYLPVQVHSDVSSTGWSDWVSVSVGNTHVCGIRRNGTLWCWGQATDGKLGDNQATTDRLRPVQVHSDVSSTGWSDWISVSADQYHTCGLRRNGTAWCWGDATYGKLGDNQTTTDGLRPVQVHSDVSSTGWSDWISIVASKYHTCGVRTDGTGWCWGYDIYGGLGSNKASGSAGTARPRRVLDSAGTGYWTDWVYIAAGGNNGSCGLRANGTAWCWGDNAGQIGDNTTNMSSFPVQVHSDTSSTGWTDWTSISRGGHSCGARANGTVWCWGPDYSNQIGNGPTDSPSLRPSQVP